MRWVPWPIFRIFVGLGVAVAVLCMPEQRRQSRDFLAVAMGRSVPGSWTFLAPLLYLYRVSPVEITRGPRRAASRRI